MKPLYILIPLLLIAPFALADEPVRERIEWIDIWVTDADAIIFEETFWHHISFGRSLAKPMACSEATRSNRNCMDHILRILSHHQSKDGNHCRRASGRVSVELLHHDTISCPLESFWERS